MVQRTAIPSVRALLTKVCQLLALYGVVMRAVVPVEKHIYIDALMQACEDFINNIPHPSKGD